MRRLLVLCLVVLTPVLAAKAQDVPQSETADKNVVTYAPAEPAAAPASPQVFTGTASGSGDWEISIGYQFNEYHLQDIPVDNGRGFRTNGYNVGFTRFINNWFGIEGAAGFGFGKTGTTTVPANQTFKSLFVGGGPHIAFRSDSRLEPWVHGLVGLEHFRFPQGGSPQGGSLGDRTLGSNSTLGWLAGGGLDYHLDSRIAIRGEGDYLGTQFFGHGHRNLQVVAGVVFSF
jgi:opacity protein-like surface antigen